MTTLEQSDLEAARVLAAQHREEGQRLSAEVARLREERDLIAGALRRCAAVLSGETMTKNALIAALEASRAALASLGSPQGSPQDERNQTQKEDAK
jgi:hypothetical protein